MKPVEADRAAMASKPKTPQTASPSYRLAFDDPEFLRIDALRGARLQLEYQKVEHLLQEMGVSSTVILFGGARIPAPGAPAKGATPEIRAKLADNAKYYEQARRFAKRVTEHGKLAGDGEFVIATGGGPGVMEAGNRGAHDAGGRSMGLSIVLPFEEAPNAYVTPEMCFNFHYFSVRKFHFLLRAKAIAVFPGGFGTFDELFEALTLMQTGRMDPTPLMMFGESFWREVVDFDALAANGVISPEDVDLISFVETAEEAWEKIADFHGLAEGGFKRSAQS